MIIPLATAVAQILNQRSINKDLKTAQGNLTKVEDAGVQRTVSPEVLAAYQTAVKQYKEAQERAQTGYSPAEKAQLNQQIAEQNTAQRINALEMGGDGADVNSALKGNSINAAVNAAAQSAQLKLAKQQFADYQYGNMANSANTINITNQNDVERYRGDLTAIGRAISDLRMQKLKNREGLGITFDSILSSSFGDTGEAIAKSGAGGKQGGGQNDPNLGGSNVDTSSQVNSLGDGTDGQGPLAPTTIPMVGY